MQSSAFTGRKKQLDILKSLLHPVPDADQLSRILYAHGPVGIGKTALLDRYAALAEEARRPVLRVDAARISSTDELRVQAEQTGPPPGTVVLIDNVDAHPELVPALIKIIADILPADAIAVLTAERAPNASWLGAAGWHRVVHDLPLDPLDPQEAEQALDALDLSTDLRPMVAEFSQGHPLALALGAAAARAGQFTDGEVPQQLVLQLLDRIIGTVPGPAYRAALEVSAHSRWTTEDLLRSVLGAEQPTADIFDWLRRLPFVTSERRGLSPVRWYEPFWTPMRVGVIRRGTVRCTNASATMC
ncbi:ATP-binding protein [Streptomyces sp. FXJ1.4098]|nr:ATP-binding protein [Streptomyces sp. FXJ1.4098]